MLVDVVKHPARSVAPSRTVQGGDVGVVCTVVQEYVGVFYTVEQKDVVAVCPVQNAAFSKGKSLLLLFLLSKRSHFWGLIYETNKVLAKNLGV